MPVLSLDALLAHVKKGQLQPLYVIVGDDEGGKDQAVAAFVAAVPEDVQAFALERLSALESDAPTVVAAARTLPLLGDRRVVIVTRAEKWLTGKRKAKAESGDDDRGDADGDEGASGGGGLDMLESYAESPEPLSTLVIVAADINRTLRVVKALLKTATLVECWGLKDEKELRGGYAVNDVLERAGRYIVAELRKTGLTIDRRALEPLLAHAGADIATLRGDVERLALFCHGKGTVTVEDVQSIVSGGAQVNKWGVVNAIERSDAREALRQLALAMEAGEVPFMILGQIGWFIRNRLVTAAPPRVPAAVDALFRADVAMKSSGGEARVLLERLIVELCGRGGPAPGSRGGGASRGPGGYR
jgi:DNA polymerase III subunit delta